MRALLLGEPTLIDGLQISDIKLGGTPLGDSLRVFFRRELESVYTEAVRAFPEFEDKGETEWHLENQLIRPPDE